MLYVNTYNAPGLSLTNHCLRTSTIQVVKTNNDKLLLINYNNN